MFKHLWIVLLLTSSLSNAQLITEANGRFGLVDRSGRILLDPIFDRITEFNGDGPVFVYERDGMSGLAIPACGILLPCDATIERVAKGLFIECSPIGCRIISGHQTTNGDWQYTVSMELYDEAWRLNDEHIGVRIGNSYGAVSNVYPPAKIAVPVQFDFPIRRKHPYGYYSYNHAGHVVVYSKGSDGLYGVACASRATEPAYDTHFLWWYTPTRDSLCIVDARTGMNLKSHAHHPQNGQAASYNERWQCVSTRTPTEKNRYRIALINPLTGEALCEEVVEEATVFELSSDPLTRSMEATVDVALLRFKARANVYTHIGQMTGYRFVPAAERTVTKQRFSGGGKTVPFFMPGER